MKDELRTVLKGIAEQWSDHDFTGEVLDDRMWEVLALVAVHYLSEKDIEALKATASTEDDECQAVGAGQRMVLLMYLRTVVKGLEEDFDQVLPSTGE